MVLQVYLRQEVLQVKGQYFLNGKCYTTILLSYMIHIWNDTRHTTHDERGTTPKARRTTNGEENKGW